MAIKNIGNFAILLIAVLFSGFTLWLIDSWIKYLLFPFEVVVILIMCLVLNNKEVIYSKVNIGRHNLLILIDLLLPISAIVLLVFNILSVQGGIIQSALSLLITTFLPGYALLNIFGFEKYFSKLEAIILSYILSYFITGMLTLIFLTATPAIRVFSVMSIFACLGVISLAKHLRNESSVNPVINKSLARNIDALCIAVTLLFMILSFVLIYPNFALLPSTDISQHYSLSMVLSKTPNLYIGSAYLLAHLHESFFILSANSSLLSTQIALLSLNLLLPIVFYALAKAYLERFDPRLPSIATLFWVLFTSSLGGFAWIYFADLKFSLPNTSTIQLLSLTANKTYNGTIYGIFGLWYVPATISFIVLLTLIFLLKKTNIPKSMFFALFSLIVVALFLTHVVEALIFALFLAFYGIIDRKEIFRINLAILSTIVGYIISAIVYLLFSQITSRFLFNSSMLLSFAVSIPALIFCLLFRNFKKLASFNKFSLNLKVSYARFITILLLLVYSIAFLSWAFLAFTDAFTHSQFVDIGSVPWFMYPMVLGINGLLGLASLYVVMSDGHFLVGKRNILLLVLFVIFTLFLGKIVTFLNSNNFDTNFWEQRVVFFTKIALAPLAAITVVYFIDKIKSTRTNRNKFFSTILVGTIVLYGISTTFLNLEYWQTNTENNPNVLTSKQLNTIESLKVIFREDPTAWVLALSAASKSYLLFAAPSEVAGTVYSYKLDNPESALAFLYRSPIYSHPYIFVKNNDRDRLATYNNGFITNYLSSLPIVLEDSEATLYNASKTSFASPNSKNSLIVPLDNFLQKDEILSAYYLLSQGLYNFTTRYDLDSKVLDSQTAILSFDPLKSTDVTYVFHDSFDSFSNWDVRSGQWTISNGYLYGGNGSQQFGIALIPSESNRFESTFLCKAVVPSSSYAYADLVYSWIDSKNYRTAGAYFSSDGYIYLRIVDNIKGQTTVFPPWPGINTMLKWDSGDTYAVTIRVDKAINQVLLNGTVYLTQQLSSQTGQIGVRYSTTNSSYIKFDQFDLNITRSLQARDFGSYLNYINNGGRVVVLNTNGYNSFSELLFDESSAEMASTALRQPVEIVLPENVITPMILPKDGVQIISEYVSRTGSVPFIAKKDIGSGQVYYVNIFPLINATRYSSNSASLYSLFGQLLAGINLEKINSLATCTFDAAVKEISAANSTIRTDSVLFEAGTSIEQLEVQSNGISETFKDANNIIINNIHPLKVLAKSFGISNGRGLYANINFNSTFIIEENFNSIEVQFNTPAGKINLVNVNRITFVPNLNASVQMIARTPSITAESVLFKEIYTEGSLRTSTRVFGGNILTDSTTAFTLNFSDNLDFISVTSLGSISNKTQQFDELATLPIAIFSSFLLLIILFVFYYLLIKQKNETQTC